MKVPLLDLKAQLRPLRKQIDAQIDEVLESCQFVNGPKVEELEKQIAGYLRTEHAIGVSSGTDALLVSLMALGIGAGDLVITTPYSFFATAGAIARVGAEPVFVDIDLETYNLDGTALQQWFDENPTRAGQVKAVIPVHLYGQCCDMDPVIRLSHEFGFAVIEDAAQAIGSGYQSSRGARLAGEDAHLGCFSFFPSKNLGCMGDGGIVTANDAELAARVRKLRGHGASPKYYHQLVGGNFRLDALQAAILLAKLPMLDDWHRERQKNAAYYDSKIDGIGDIVIPSLRWDRSQHIYNQYVLRTSRRDDLREHLKQAGIGTEIYYPVPFHLQECFQYLGYERGAFPCSECAADQTLAIPIYPELTQAMQDYVVETIKEFYA